MEQLFHFSYFICGIVQSFVIEGGIIPSHLCSSVLYSFSTANISRAARTTFLLEFLNRQLFRNRKNFNTLVCMKLDFSLTKNITTP